MAITDILTINNPDFGLEESIQFATDIDEAENGNEVRDVLVDDGLREYKLSLSYIDKTTMDSFWNFYLDRKGSYDDFLIKVIHEFKAEDEFLGYSDGTTKVFTLHNFPVDTSANHSCTVGGVANTDYTLSNDTENEISYITFNTAPAAGPVSSSILVTYEYYLRVRFKNDSYTRQLMNHDLLSAGLEFVEVRWNTYRPISGRSSSSSSSSSATTSTRWYGLYGTAVYGYVSNWNGSDILYQSSTPEVSSPGSYIINDCTFVSMRIWLPQAPGLGKSRTFSLCRLDYTYISTGLSVTISGLATTGSINLDVPITRGDSLIIREDKVGSPSDCQIAIAFIVRTGDPRRQVLPAGSTRSMSVMYPFGSYGHQYIWTFYDFEYTGKTYIFDAIVTTPGYLKRFMAKASRPSGFSTPPSTPDTMLIKKASGSSGAGVSTDLSVTLDTLEYLGYSDDSDVRVTAGEMFIYRNTSSYSYILKGALDFVPDTPKHGIYGCSYSAITSSNIINGMYGSVHGNCQFQPLSSREEVFTLFPMGGYLTNFDARSDMGFVAGFPMTLTFRKNGVDTNFTMTFSNVIWRVTSTCMFRVEQGDRVSLKITAGQAPSGSPGTYGFNMGYTFIPDNGGDWPIMMTHCPEI